MIKLTNENIKWLIICVGSVFFTVNPKRRPQPSLSADQKAWIEKAWEETRPARLLFYELRRRGQHVPHNKIHQNLRETGRTMPNPRKQQKRKR